MRKCKWCKKDISMKRKDALFCRRSCKGMYGRCEKNKLKNVKIM